MSTRSLNTQSSLYSQAASQNIWQNAYVHNASRAHLSNQTGGKEWRDWSYVSFITNNAFLLMVNMFSTLDIVVQEVVKNAIKVNSAQFILLAIVGIVCCTLVTAFVFWNSAQVRRLALAHSSSDADPCPRLILTASPYL